MFLVKHQFKIQPREAQHPADVESQSHILLVFWPARENHKVLRASEPPARAVLWPRSRNDTIPLVIFRESLTDEC